ncbi:MAG: glycosyltransferase family 9 protein [Helicobacteraceae bacterium]|nr:glycosyltransferase family 9 protein [Helicobacteraceae bacterium]
MKILVIRNDKLGDLINALPSFEIIKRAIPEARITALLPEYTAPIAEICPFIDDVIVDRADDAAVIAEIKSREFDAAIAYFSTMRTALILRKAKVKRTLAPATKIAQFLYKDRLKQRRSRSVKSESEYNIDLTNYFLKGDFKAKIPLLEIDEKTLRNQREKLARNLRLNAAKKRLFFHAASGGSVNRLSSNQAADLINKINAEFDFEIVLTAAPSEKPIASEIRELCDQKEKIFIYAENDGLVDFARSVALCDLMICVSSGPLHLAAAFNKPTIGFFPASRVESNVRWQPINDPKKHLAISAKDMEKKSMDSIDIGAEFERIREFIAKSAG